MNALSNQTTIRDSETIAIFLESGSSELIGIVTISGTKVYILNMKTHVEPSEFELIYNFDDTKEAI